MSYSEFVFPEDDTHQQNLLGPHFLSIFKTEIRRCGVGTVGTLVLACMWRSEDSLRESVLPPTVWSPETPV